MKPKTFAWIFVPLLCAGWAMLGYKLGEKQGRQETFTKIVGLGTKESPRYVGFEMDSQGGVIYHDKWTFDWQQGLRDAVTIHCVEMSGLIQKLQTGTNRSAMWESETHFSFMVEEAIRKSKLRP